MIRSPGRPSAEALLLAGVLATVALGFRLVPWDAVYGGASVHFTVDSDPAYHVLRAERWLAGAPGAPWRDPSLAWPYGAPVPWPPLFDGLIAGAACLLYGATPGREQIAGVAAALPPLFGLTWVMLVWWLGRILLGARRGLLAGMLVAVLPWGVAPTLLGRADQHAMELPLFTAILVVVARSLRPGARVVPHAVTMAVLVAASFWTWMGSALHLVVPLASVAVWHLMAPRDPAVARATRVVAAGCMGAAALLLVSVALFGAPGALANGSVLGVGGLHVALAGAGGAYAALLLYAARRRAARAPGPSARALGEVAVAALLPGALLLAFSAPRGGIAGALAALTRGNPWYQSISEFEPLLNLGEEPLASALAGLFHSFGFTALIVVPGVFALSRRRGASRQPTPTLAMLGVGFLLLVGATLFVRRFGVYAMVPVAVVAEAGVRWLTAVAVAWWRRRGYGLRPAAASWVLIGGAVLALVPALPAALRLGAKETPGEEPEQLLRWIASWPVREGAEAVLAPWPTGHWIQYYGGRPVLASPFGTEGGPRAMEDAAEFWFATSQPEGDRALSRRRVGLVLVHGLGIETDAFYGFAPPGTPPPFVDHRDLLAGGSSEDTPALWTIVPSRLYAFDGSATEAAPALDGFRLLFETSSSADPGDLPSETRWMLFEPVPGAQVELHGASGSARAEVQAVTNAGRTFTWGSNAEADGAGVARFRLPYASGLNGAVRASVWTLSSGGKESRLVLHEDDILDARRILADLASGAASRP